MTDTVEVDREFLRQMVAVLDSKELSSIFGLAHIHGFAYSGPTIDMPRLRALAGVPEPDDNS